MNHSSKPTQPPKQIPYPIYAEYSTHQLDIAFQDHHGYHFLCYMPYVYIINPKSYKPQLNEQWKRRHSSESHTFENAIYILSRRNMTVCNTPQELLNYIESTSQQRAHIHFYQHSRPLIEELGLIWPAPPKPSKTVYL